MADAGVLAPWGCPSTPAPARRSSAFVQWVAAAAIAPIAALGGNDTAVRMALLTIAGAAVSLFGFACPGPNGSEVAPA